MLVSQHEVADRAARRRFMRLPFHLYRDHPLWVPPVLVEQRAALSRRRNPFFAHSDAALLLAARDGRDVGRLLVMEHRPFNEHTGGRDVLFDLFECEDDPEAAAALVGAAAEWGRRRSLNRLSGPRRFLAGTPSGVLVAGFEHPPALAVPWNPPYYDALLTGSGMIKELDLLSAFVDLNLAVPVATRQAATALMAELGLSRFSHSSRRAMWRDRMTLVRLYNRSFAGQPGFCPLTDPEMRLMARGMALIADPDIVFYVKRGDEIVAFMSLVPDVTAGIRRSRGRLFPFGWWHILREVRRTALVDIHIFGVVPEYRGTGMNVVAYTFLAALAASSRYHTAEAIHVEETNSKMVRNLDLAGGITWAKRHRVYAMPLSPRGAREVGSYPQASTNSMENLPSSPP